MKPHMKKIAVITISAKRLSTGRWLMRISGCLRFAAAALAHDEFDWRDGARARFGRVLRAREGERRGLAPARARVDRERSEWRHAHRCFRNIIEPGHGEIVAGPA